MAGGQNTPDDKDPLEIAIIGGGIGGTILSIGLQKHNIRFKIYEAAQEFGEIGAGVSCSPNAVSALSLISPELFEAYKKHETPNMSTDLSHAFLMMRHGTNDQSDGKQRWRSGDFAFINEGKAKCPPDILRRSSVHRARFLDEIVKLIPEGVATFGKALAGLEELSESEGGKIRMHFADGSIAEADAVIGCDGIKSVTRDFLYGGQIQPRFTNSRAYRALVPADELKAAIGPDRALNGTMYIGPDGCFLHYPVEHGHLINTIAIKYEEGSEWTDENWQTPCDSSSVLRDFEGWETELLGLLIKHGAKTAWGLFDLPHDKPYYKGRVCLLGDSCHATTPHLGAGAGQAMEDAYILSNLLAKVRTRADLERAFQAYDSVRRPRSQKIIAASRESGDTFYLRHSESLDDPVKVRAVQARLLGYTWDIDLREHLQSALELMAA